MNEYRALTDEEILTLEENGCWAQDWTEISVAEDFMPTFLKNVNFWLLLMVKAGNKSR